MTASGDKVSFTLDLIASLPSKTFSRGAVPQARLIDRVGVIDQTS